MAISVMSLGLVACGQVEPVVVTVSMPDCIAQAPPTMRAGNARMSLTLNGLGDSGAALVQLKDDHTYSELVDQFKSDNRWEHRPDWVSPKLELRLDSADGLDGVDKTVYLVAGDYAVVCIDHPYDGSDDTAQAAARLEVKAP